MSFNIPKNDIAFRPLVLPKDGEDLIAGRQYYIDPVARAVIVNNYGLMVPRYVECLQAKSPARTITVTTKYADQRPERTTVQEEPGQDATFRAFYKYKKIAKFTLDLTVVEYQRQFYQDAKVEPDAIDDEDYEPEVVNGKVVKRKRDLTLEEIMAL